MNGKAVFGNSYLKRLAIISLIAAVVIAVVVGTQVIIRKFYPDRNIERLKIAQDEILGRLASIEESQKNPFAPVIDHVKQTIVHIITYDGNDRPKGTGSGIVIDKTKGYILTNYHVIENSARIKVIFPNTDSRHDIAEGSFVPIVGYDRLSDLALLKSHLPPKYNLPLNVPESVPEIEWGNSENLQVGEWAIAIGYPHAPIGQANPTVTAGIVSAANRNFLEMGNRLHIEMIQTDAPINAGNSGGALVNIHGQLIGINTLSKPKYYAEGMSYAIPANTAKKVVEQLITHGCVIPPYLGIHTQRVTRDLLEKLKMPPFLSAVYVLSHPLGLEDDREPNYSGVFVTDIDEGSPADKAGISRGDFIGSRVKSDIVPPEFKNIICHFVDFKFKLAIENEKHFTAMTRLLPVNQQVAFCLTRPVFDPSYQVEISGSTYVKTTLEKHSAELNPEVLQWNYTPPRWGITLKQPSREEAETYKRRGVIVTSITPETTLATALKPGDLIYRIVSKEVEIVKGNKQPLLEFEIHSLEEFIIYAPMLTSGKQFWFYFERDGKNETKLLTIPKD